MLFLVAKVSVSKSWGWRRAGVPLVMSRNCLPSLVSSIIFLASFPLAVQMARAMLLRLVSLEWIELASYFLM